MNIFQRYDFNGVLQTGLDIFDRQIRIVVPDDIRKGDAILHQLQHGLNRDARTGHTGFSEMNIWLDSDPFMHSFTFYVQTQRTPLDLGCVKKNDQVNRAADHQEPARTIENRSNSLTVESPEK